jgi:MFS family permease
MSSANDSLHEPLIPVNETNKELHVQDKEEPLLSPHEQQQQQQCNVRLVDGMPWSTSLLIKTLYFLEALCAASWGRFATIYYNLHGLNRAQVGMLEGIMPCVRTIFKPMWGILSDKYNCRKLVYLLTKIVSTLLLLLLSLSVVYTSYTNIICVSLGVMVFSANGILDAYTLELLGSKNKLRYGRYRMFACLSWGIGAIVMGYVTDHYGFGPNFYIYGTLGAISTLLVAWRIPNVKQQQEQQDESGSVVQLLLLATRPRVTFFLLEVIIVGIGMGTVERLLFLYMVDDLQASTLLCGASVGVNVLLELPIFWNAVRFGDSRVLYIAIMLCPSSILTPLYF